MENEPLPWLVTTAPAVIVFPHEPQKPLRYGGGLWNRDLVEIMSPWVNSDFSFSLDSWILRMSSIVHRVVACYFGFFLRSFVRLVPCALVHIQSYPFLASIW